MLLLLLFIYFIDNMYLFILIIQLLPREEAGLCKCTTVEVCKPVAEFIRDSTFFFFYRWGSGWTRAHLASLLLLCPYTRRAHMATV